MLKIRTPAVNILSVSPQTHLFATMLVALPAVLPAGMPGQLIMIMIINNSKTKSKCRLVIR